MTDASTGQVTALLRRWRSGDPQALNGLIPLVYAELRRLARGCLRGERGGHTLQATALVHEAFLRLVDADVSWQDRAHFLAVAARAMRRVLVDHARARRRVRRAGGVTRVTLDEALLVTPEPSADLLAIDEALDRLAKLDERQSRAVELHFFGGLSYAETAAVLEVSEATVHRDLRSARAFIRSRMTRSERG